MSILGELFGYDRAGDDMLGSNRDIKYNCLACGTNAMRHSPEQMAECAQKIFGMPECKSSPETERREKEGGK